MHRGKLVPTGLRLIDSDLCLISCAHRFLFLLLVFIISVFFWLCVVA